MSTTIRVDEDTKERLERLKHDDETRSEFLDSSVIIDYLGDVERVVDYVDDQPTLRTSSLCVYEVLEGEVLGSGETDIAGARQHFGRIEAIDFSETIALEAARLQDRLVEHGEIMSVHRL